MKGKKQTTVGENRLGPGEYTQIGSGLVGSLEEVPQARIIRQSRNYPRRPCPWCGKSSYRDKVYTRKLHDVGDLKRGYPQDIELTYSQHCCSTCGKYFQADSSDLAPPNSQYTHRVIGLAVRLVVEDGLPYRSASWHLWRDHRVFVPFATLQNWVEVGGKKSAGTRRERVSGLGTQQVLGVSGRRRGV